MDTSTGPDSEQQASSWDAFISHSSKDDALASRLVSGLQELGIVVWVDQTKLRAGGLLINDLQTALENSANLVLVWSEPASESRWVQAEWQAAFHLQKGILPCRLDDTRLPAFLRCYLSCDFRASYETGLAELAKAFERSTPVPAEPIETQQLGRDRPRQEIVRRLYDGQNQILTSLSSHRLTQAAQLQAELDPLLAGALQRYAEDEYVLNLGGYHYKNAYMIRHWAAIQARQFPRDQLLEESEKLFFAALSIQPGDPSALNGIGNVLLFRGDLDAAEFYVTRALAGAQAENLPTEAIEHDLRTIRRLKGERED